MTGPYTVADYLGADLHPGGGVPHLQQLAGQVAAQDLDVTTGQIRQALQGMTPERYRRLHILINSLYQARRMPLDVVTALQMELNRVLSAGRKPS